MAHVCILDRDAPVRRDVLLETSPAWSTLRVWLGVLRENLRDGLHDLLAEALPGPPESAAAPASVATVPPLPAPSPARVPVPGLSPIQVQCRLETAVSDQRQPASSLNRLRGMCSVPWLLALHRSPWRSAWPSRFNVSSTRPVPNSGVESKTARSGCAPKPPVFSAKATVRSNSVLSR